MYRKATVIKCSPDGKRCIAVDEQNYEAILAFLTTDQRHKKKFNFITDTILAGLRNPELYDKEEPDSKSKGVRAMKFFKGQENARIYCREIYNEDKIFVVIASELLLRKKTQKIDTKILSIIHKVASYEYDEINFIEED